MMQHHMPACRLSVLALLFFCIAVFTIKTEAAETGYSQECPGNGCRSVSPSSVVICKGHKTPSADGKTSGCTSGVQSIENYIEEEIKKAVEPLQKALDDGSTELGRQGKNLDALNTTVVANEAALSVIVEARLMKALLHRIQALETRLKAVEAR